MLAGLHSFLVRGLWAFDREIKSTLRKKLSGLSME